MSLDGFHSALARLVADPDLVRSVRAGEVAWIHGSDLTGREAARVIAIASDPRMEVMCSLYRSNRLTALVRTVPAVVVALGDRLSGAVTEYWRDRPRTDMQFRTEAAEFCAFVGARFDGDAPLVATVHEAMAALGRAYDGDEIPAGGVPAQ